MTEFFAPDEAGFATAKNKTPPRSLPPHLRASCGPHFRSPRREVIAVNSEYLDGNRRGIGSVIELTDRGRTQRRWLIGGGSFHSSNAPVAYFGIGSEERPNPRTIKVTWPDDTVTTRDAVPKNCRISIQPGVKDGPVQPLGGRRRPIKSAEPASP